MNITESLKIAVKCIKSNWMLSLLTMLCIIIGISSVIMIIGAGTGVRDYIVGLIEDMGSNAVLVSVDTTSATDNDYITLDDVENIKNHKTNLVNYFIKSLSDIPEIIIYDNFNIERGPVVALNIKGIPSSELSDILSEEFNICTRGGFHCAPLAHKYLGTYEDGAVRFSFGYTNTIKEIDYCISALKEIISFFYK